MKKILVLCITVLISASVVAKTNIDAIRVWPAPDHTRIVFDLDKKPEYKIFQLGNPSRVVVDISNAQTAAKLLDNMDLEGSGISGIRSAKQANGSIRFVFDLKENLKPNSFPLPPADIYNHRLVLDLKRSTQAVSSNTVSLSASSIENQKRDIVIAIDAGHGGEDPGAIGPGRTFEKNIVLAIAKELEALLDKEPGFRPVLVREGDYFILLNKRREIARQAQADFFVSIHADAFTSPLARGMSVYALSDRGATSSMAKYLADKENASDLIGGVESIKISDIDHSVAEILTDLSFKWSREYAMAASEHILQGLDDVGHMHSTTLQQGSFVVLKSPDIPSLLIETGYISNPREEKNLGSKAYRQSIAKAIFEGIVTQFTNSPPEGSLIAWNKKVAKEFVEHKVRSGETLSGIAVKYRVKLSDIRSVNALKSDVIRVGQIIKIPRSS